MTALRSPVVALAFVSVLAACGAPASSVSAPASAEARDADFILVITSPADQWAVGQAIEVEARLSYVGPGEEETTIWSSVGGVISFEVVELTGRRRMDAIRDAACARYSISHAKPIKTLYRKSGEINPGGPDEAFYREFFDDPLFRLPSGRWRITAWASLAVQECGGRQVDLRASLTITVK